MTVADGLEFARQGERFAKRDSLDGVRFEDIGKVDNAVVLAEDRGAPGLQVAALL